jgi:hypothetical protein
MGWLKKWDIQSYCQHDEQLGPPALAAGWQAHHQAITALQLNEDVGRIPSRGPLVY